MRATVTLIDPKSGKNISQTNLTSAGSLTGSCITRILGNQEFIKNMTVYFDANSIKAVNFVTNKG